MAQRLPISLSATLVTLDAAEFHEVCNWPFADQYVRRLLQTDIPVRVRRGGALFVYRDPDEQIVGFGTLDLSTDWEDYAGGGSHPYIPLLAVNPTRLGRGHGKSIVRHLIDEAAMLVKI